MLIYKGIKNFFRKIEICTKIVAFFVEILYSTEFRVHVMIAVRFFKLPALWVFWLCVSFCNALTRQLHDFLCAQSVFVDAGVINQVAQRHTYLICPFMDLRGRACPIGII